MYRAKPDLAVGENDLVGDSSHTTKKSPITSSAMSDSTKSNSCRQRAVGGCARSGQGRVC